MTRSRIVPFDSLQPFQAVNLLSDPGHIAGPKVIPNACQVTLYWNLTSGKIGHNVMYASWSGSPALSTGVADAIRTAIMSGAAATALLAQVATTASFGGVAVLDVRDATHTPFASLAVSAGTNAGTALPDENAVAITLRTAQRGPSGRGRIYIPGLTSAAVGTGNIVAAAAVTAIQNWAQQALLPGIQAQLGPVVLGLPARNAYTSPATGRTFPARTATTVLVTQAIVRDNHWDTQRRRGLK